MEGGFFPRATNTTPISLRITSEWLLAPGVALVHLLIHCFHNYKMLTSPNSHGLARSPIPGSPALLMGAGG